MQDLKGKKLLILGGTTLLKHVVETARSMGVYTIVTDKDPKSPAKFIADMSYDISTNDIDALVNLATKEKTDGVFTGYEDFNTTIACQLCKRLNLPFYATQEQIDITKNKIVFKDMCRKYDVPVVKEFYNDEEVIFPCVTKPSDSYSGKGILICNDKEELEYGKKYARSFSKSDQYLIEKFMDSHVVECINIDYVIKDGEIKLSAVGDKYVNDEQGNKTPLTAGVLYPSIRQEEYIQTLNDKVINMFRGIGLKNGTLFIESFYDEDGFHFYEMGYRLGGGQSSILLNSICGIDYVKMLITFALTGNMCDNETWNRVSPSFNKVACGLVILIKSGIIAEIDGVDKIKSMPGVVKYTQYYNIGDGMPKNLVGTLGQTFARVHIVCENMSEFGEILDEIKSSLKIHDEENDNMLLSIVCKKMYNYVNAHKK